MTEEVVLDKPSLLGSLRRCAGQLSFCWLANGLARVKL